MTDIRAFLAGKTDHPILSGTLVDRLRDELRFIQQGLGVEVILDCEPENLDLPVEIEREVYYVLREGLTNITRHANASRTEIHIKRSPYRLEASISDDGIGFHDTARVNRGGLGLAAMAERIKKLGGEFAVESSPGRGTNISFVVALSN
jgi:two-component system nitrate/nitrite sensor histidine kinase NarX